MAKTKKTPTETDAPAPLTPEQQENVLRLTLLRHTIGLEVLEALEKFIDGQKAHNVKQIGRIEDQIAALTRADEDDASTN